jgi:hypothetical protein
MVALFFLAGGWAAWALGGMLVNRRLATALSRWVYEQAKPYGAKVQVRWITLAACEVSVPEARAPFRQLSITVLLKSRDTPFVWLLNRTRGRSDLLQARIEPRRRPAVALELFRPGGVLAGDARRAAEQAGWTVEDGPDGLLVASAHGARHGERLLREVGCYAPYVERLATREQPPQVVLAIRIGEVPQQVREPLGPCLVRLVDAAARRDYAPETG